MIVSEVRIHLPAAGESDKVLCYVTLALDGVLVIHDCKLIRSHTGAAVLAMPSRRRSDRCELCGGKNAVTARFCQHCGERQGPGREWVTRLGGARELQVWVDVCHPITAAFRAELLAAVLAAYETELARAREPEHACTP